jgi:hypothetical protein
MRTQLLRASGYDAAALEFVATSHTPKNTLIRAMRRGDHDETAWAAFASLKEATGNVTLALERRLRPDGR